MNKTLSTAIAMMAATGCLTLAVRIDAAEAARDKPASQKDSIERGRYIAKVAGCNDCHTPGYAMTGGQVPEKDWLVGDHLGWKGPWGTTYPANLRMSLANISEDD